MKQSYLPLRHELVVVNFAGGGGACKGIVRATGRAIDIAINHDAEAIAMHAANHPTTEHYVEDVFAVKPREVTRGQPVGLAWFSPDCKHFSKAKGGKPVEKKIRGLAWVVIKWARVVKPRIIMLENVEEFEDWGPLRADNTPCPLRKGLTFRRWKKQLENCGYVVEMKQLRACDYGTPTIRKRLFIIARCDGRAIVWPKRSHGIKRERGEKGKLKPIRTAAECIDWSTPCPSIFTRKKELVSATMRRIAKGVTRYVIECADPFIVPVTHQGGDRVHGIDDPFRTITSAQRGELAFMAPSLVGVGGRMGQSEARPVDRPYHTTTAKADTALVIPTLIQTGYGERPGQAPRVPGLEKPLGTAVDGQKHALVAIHLQRQFGKSVGHGANEPMGSITAGGGGKTSIAGVFLAQHNSDKNGRSRPGRSLNEPVSTLTSIAKQQQQVVAFMEQANTDMVGHDMREPVSTIVGKGCTQRLIAVLLTHFHKSNSRGGKDDPREPMNAITAGGTHKAIIECTLSQEAEEGALRVARMLLKYGERAMTDKQIDKLTVEELLAVVTVNIKDTWYVIVDIGMRMLQPRELYRAQGFPDDYIIDPIVNGKPLTKTAQVRMCGNSVCPPVAEALVRANFEHESRYEAVA